MNSGKARDDGSAVENTGKQISLLPARREVLLRRQRSILECAAHGEIHYSTLLDGFYFNARLQLQLADQDQAFLKALHAAGQIWHKPLGGFEFSVRFAETNNTN